MFHVENNKLVQYTGSKCEVRIPEGIKVIGTCSFKDCSNITKVIIPSSVECVEENAFVNCEKLEHIEYP